MATTIDSLCEQTLDAETLNALHACRDGHPMGRGKSRQENYLNAASVCCGQIEFTTADIQWLERQAHSA